MSKVDMRTQMEASMLSMTLILFGMMTSVVYFTIFFTFPLWYKIVLVINGLAGVVFLSSFLVTTYQQYISYLSITAFQNKLKGGTQE